MTNLLDVLARSVDRLRAIAEPLTAEQLRAPAYPSEWTIADVLSHIGSSWVIIGQRITAAVDGHTLSEGFETPIWDGWNAKSPEVQATDALAADAAGLVIARSLTDEQRSQVSVPMGPMELPLATLLGLRLNEHALHTWDIEVALDPGAALPTDAADLVVDNLGMIVQYTGKPTGVPHQVHVTTTDPKRELVLALGTDSVSLTPAHETHDPDLEADLELPAEALVRLVYGRLDAAHTPPVRGTADLDELRGVFPGA